LFRVFAVRRPLLYSMHRWRNAEHRRA
jgi:hypothetical protein